MGRRETKKLLIICIIKVTYKLAEQRPYDSMITIHTSKLLNITKSKVRIRVVYVSEVVTTIKIIPKQSGTIDEEL